MNYALDNTSEPSIASIAANAPKAMMDASDGTIKGSVRPKGLILTKEQIICLHRYEKKGLLLPTSASDVSAYLGYDQGTSPGRGLEIKDFVNTFTIIKSHANTWDGLRQRIKLISSELKIFASSIINTGKHASRALATIEALKFLKEHNITSLDDLRKVEAEMGTAFPGIELNDGDEQAISTFSGYLDRLLDRITIQARHTGQLKADLDTFAKQLATVVRGEIKIRLTAIENNTFKEDIILLQAEIEALNKDIDKQSVSYKKMVNDSLSSASALNVIGLGMAIYIGVEAEKVRKYRNDLKTKRDEKNSQMGRKSTVLKRLNEVKADMQDIEFLSLEADAATQNLVTVWNSLNLYVQTSLEQTGAITDALQVRFLAYHLDEVIDPWTHISTQANDLHDVFMDAEAEANSLIISA
jgi:hypothetical protein